MTSPFFKFLEEKRDPLSIMKPIKFGVQIAYYLLQILCIIDFISNCSMCMMYLYFKYVRHYMCKVFVLEFNQSNLAIFHYDLPLHLTIGKVIKVKKFIQPCGCY